MTMALVVASILGTIWAWIVWIVIGGIAGALADRLVQGDQLGIREYRGRHHWRFDRWGHYRHIRRWRAGHHLDIPYSSARSNHFALDRQCCYWRPWCEISLLNPTPLSTKRARSQYFVRDRARFVLPLKKTTSILRRLDHLG